MTMTNEPSFATWLVAQRAGLLEEETSRSLAEVVRAVCATGKAGTLTLTVKVAPANKTGGSVLVVTDKVKTTIPADATDAIFYATDDGGLTRSDPRQPELLASEPRR